MAKLNYQVWYFPAGETGSSNIADSVDLMNEDGINTNADTFTFTVSNKDNKYSDTLTYGDNIEIRAGYDGSTSRLIYGKIETEEYTVNKGRRVKIIKGAGGNRTLQDIHVNQVIEAGASYVVGDYTFTENEMNCRNAVKFLINEFANQFDNVSLDWDTYVDVESGTTLWKTQLGADFYKAWSNKPISDVIDEIRSDKYTGNGDYDFYVDGDDYVHFEPTGKTASDYPITEGVNIVNYKLKRDMKPNFTAVRVFLGKDASGDSIYRVGINSTGIIQYGYKWEYVNWGHYYNDVKKSNPAGNDASWTATTRELGKIAADNFAVNEGLPKWKGTITTKGNDNYNLVSGTELLVTMPSVGEILSPGNLIIHGVRHSITTRGWTTTLKVEEKIGETF